MKTGYSALHITLALLLVAAPLSADDGSSWYIGFGAGSGAARGDGTVLFDEDADTIALPLVLNFGAGAALSRRVRLGFDYISFSHFARAGTERGRETKVLSIDDFYAALLFFPAGDRFFVKLAGGLTYLGDWDYDFFGSTADFYAGPGATAGAGAFFPLAGRMKLGIHAEYSYHRYSGGPFERTDMAVLYLSLYWF
jgi:hypothetical protein